MFLKLDDVYEMRPTHPSIPCCNWKLGDYIIIRDHTVPSSDIEIASFSWGVSNPATYAGLQIVDVCQWNLGSTHTIPPGAENGLDSSKGGLTVSNIGSSGNDGVDINLRTADEWTAAWNVICAGTYENCDTAALSMALDFTGSFGGMPGKPAGHSTVHRTGRGFFDIFADYTDIGCSSLIIKVFDEAGTMTGMAVTSSPITQIRVESPGTPSGCGKQGIIINGGRTACLWWEWNQGGIFNIPGLPPLQGHQIRILAADPPLPFDHIERARITVSGVDDLDLISETIKQVAPPVTCYADFNQDGGIDGADVSAFFAEWEAGNAAADVNQDGGIDGADVQVFIQQWENGGC